MAVGESFGGKAGYRTEKMKKTVGWLIVLLAGSLFGNLAQYAVNDWENRQVRKMSLDMAQLDLKAAETLAEGAQASASCDPRLAQILLDGSRDMTDAAKEIAR